MADTSTGVPSAAALLTLSDALASMFKGQYANLGLGASTESTTLAAYAKSARAKILGDGSTLYGLGNAPLQAALKDPLASLAASARYDSLFATYCRSIITAVNSSIQTNLPKDSATGTSWQFTSSTNLSALDSYLLYLNALNSGVPTTPAAAGTLTAATVAGGGLASAASGSAYYVVHCLVGASDWMVSLPSAEATRVTLANGNNAYTYQIAGTVPSGVRYVAVFRGLVGGSSGTWYLDTRTAVTAGESYPAITISNPDSALRTDWTPPSWAQCLWVPESAAIFALANATATSGTGAAMNPLVFTSGLQLSPNNVACTPSSGFLGIGNPAQTGILGTDIVGTGYTAGSLATANNSATNTQGFVGFKGANPIQFRVTSVLDAAGTVTATYSYYDAAHGYGSAQSASASAATFTGTAVGSTATPTIADGRIVYAVTAVTNGTTTSGTYIGEGAAGKPRSY